MNATLVSGEVRRPLHIDIQRVSLLRPMGWLLRGARDMRRQLGASLGYGGLIVAFGWTLLMFCGTHPYWVAAAISGFLLMAPVVSAGLSEMSRRQALGLRANFDDSLEGFARNAPALFEFGAILAGAAAAWFAISGVMLGTVLHIAAPDLKETLYRGFIEAANRSQVEAYVAVGAVLAAGVFALSVVAVPLIIDRHATAGEAMRASLKAVSTNLPAMLVWSALIAILTIVGYAPLMLGLLLTAPLLGHATWHAYQDMVH